MERCHRGGILLGTNDHSSRAVHGTLIFIYYTRITADELRTDGVPSSKFGYIFSRLGLGRVNDDPDKSGRGPLERAFSNIYQVGRVNETFQGQRRRLGAILGSRQHQR